MFPQPVARVFDTAQKIADKAGDKFVTVERLLLALAMEASDASRALKDAGVNPTTLNAAINDIRKGRTADWVKVGLQHPCGDFYFGEDPEAAPGVQAAMEEVKKCPTKSSSS